MTQKCNGYFFANFKSFDWCLNLKKTGYFSSWAKARNSPTVRVCHWLLFFFFFLVFESAAAHQETSRLSRLLSTPLHKAKIPSQHSYDYTKMNIAGKRSKYLKYHTSLQYRQHLKTVNKPHGALFNTKYGACLILQTFPFNMEKETLFLTLGATAPLSADLFENRVSFCPRLCCLFYRSLSLCCEGLRLLLTEVNLTTYMSYASLLSTVLFLSQHLDLPAIHPSFIFRFHSVPLHSMIYSIQVV